MKRSAPPLPSRALVEQLVLQHKFADPGLQATLLFEVSIVFVRLCTALHAGLGAVEECIAPLRELG